MLRLLLTLFIAFALFFVFAYFDKLNPGLVTVRLGPETAFELSPMWVILLSMATGVLAMLLLVGIRHTKNVIVNWRSTKLRRRSEKVEALHRDGTHAFLAKRTGEAISLFQKALAIDPNHADSLLWLGNIHRAEQNYAEAIRLHRKARTVDEGNIEILFALARDPGVVFAREQLMEKVWGYRDFAGGRVVDSHVARIRRKLGEDGNEPRFIRTVHGVGYAFRDGEGR
jgi:DNA-binding response OmpR family regulator